MHLNNMPTLKENLDALDRMVTNHASTAEIRSQIAFIERELTAFEAEYMSTARSYVRLQDEHKKLQHAQLARDQETVAENRHKVGVTLTNGVTRYYDADTYEILPNQRDPKMVEFRRTDKAKNLYYTMATARWSEIAEVHKPTI